MAQVETPGVQRGVAGVGRIRRKGTPIPVLPPRVPSPMPPPNTRTPKAGVEVALSSVQRKVLKAQMAEKLLQEEADPMKSWINPRIFSKVNPDAVTAPEFPLGRVYRPPPEPELYRSPPRSRPPVAPAASSAPTVEDLQPRRPRATMERYSRHQLITGAVPVVGEVFIDGPLSGLPPVDRRRSSSQPPPSHTQLGTPAQASAAAAFFAR
ncbi:uncharacterized protein LOC128985280 [Macrosteles quadrilineatus]|uniref:uncharacterized protein LOC128985280 n=1 Tax=Macrosteles quadrilineatus TaxID=74068 RepID=UPI0023E2D955|nr:uncharacterized protein LOC128985280 [Macrosteles quadrilineatus]